MLAQILALIMQELGSKTAGFSRQTGGGHLAVGSNARYDLPLDGCPLFAENNPLFRSLARTDSYLDESCKWKGCIT